ncbi:isopenicillin N synthase family dioxygenase [Reichenbachiella ulvae]|uniref:Isopenicillin N synthase family oxygenase n=1 Tax=Reichenbachiella ulvae TaxID=2980104 RepID=A0ABT3CY32_9BACT|nr:2-oxoglutarate and iron-dependent oxygenase domain-containing protein [Reichenbachiella ulvae]MCV9388602.1 isopenicillin N synthase family oxygenase [Reichenbachiella ulvae]
MSDQLYDEVPSLDLANFLSEDEAKRAQFVEELGHAYNNIGFVAIKNHGLSDALVKKLYDSIEKFFSLPEEVKTKYEIPELFGQRGYVGKGKEHAKGRKTGDLKEFYHVGQFVEDGDAIKENYPDNVWPAEVEDFEAAATEAYKTLEATGKHMLRAIALYLGLEENYFESRVHNGNSILRPIHYFPIENPEEIPADAVRAAEHGDINLITLLMGASADGLQVKRRDDKWIPITALPEQIVVNVGDMLARLTNNKLKSTIHRVVNPPKEQMKSSRYSIPFFMHPRAEMDLTCLESCIDENHPKEFDDMTAGEFLHQRLTEIGLKK